jgi:hypothetical protein
MVPDEFSAIFKVTAKLPLLLGFVAVIPLICIPVPGSRETFVIFTVVPLTEIVGVPNEPETAVGAVTEKKSGRLRIIQSAGVICWASTGSTK